MSVYIALFRGLNVGGRILKMADLRMYLQAAQCQDVRTYLQSGNAIFTRRGSAASARSAIEKVIMQQFGEHVPTLVKSRDAWRLMLDANPWLQRRGIDDSKLHVTLLDDTPSPAQLQKLAPKLAPDEGFDCVGAQVYLYCPGGYGNTKMNNAYFERALSTRATTRNWRTAIALAKLAAS